MSDKEPEGRFIATRSDGLKLVTHNRELHMFRVTEQELDAICHAGNYKTLDISLFTLSFGVTVSIYLTIKVASIAPQLLPSFVAAQWVFFISTLFFGSRAIISWRNANSELRRIKSNHESGAE